MCFLVSNILQSISYFSICNTVNTHTHTHRQSCCLLKRRAEMPLCPINSTHSLHSAVLLKGNSSRAVNISFTTAPLSQIIQVSKISSLMRETHWVTMLSHACSLGKIIKSSRTRVERLSLPSHHGVTTFTKSLSAGWTFSDKLMNSL